MVTIKQAKIQDLFKIKNIINDSSANTADYSSEFKGSILMRLLKGDCYKLEHDEIISGILFIKKMQKELVFIPSNSFGISFFRLIYSLCNYFEIKDYSLSVRYRKLNFSLYKKCFPIEISENFKHMHINTDIEYEKISMEGIKFKAMEVNRDENIRVMLQNLIFSDIKGRRQLTLSEVYEEEMKDNFLKDLCFIVEAENSPAGYGQILLIDNRYYLVNFGIIPEWRGKGYGYNFLIRILSACNTRGIEDLYLCVDNTNLPAIRLYEKIGFKELYNTVTINFI